MNGLLGMNVRTLNVSRDQILSAVRQLGCAFVLIQDDPDLIAPLKALGVKTIYRQSGDENLSLDPAAFVQTRAEKNADFVYCTNELDPTPEVLAYTMECMKYATSIHQRCVIDNFSTDRDATMWSKAADVCRWAVAHDHAVGLHVYQRQAQSPQSYNWLDLKHTIGGLWLVTEYAFYVDAYHGYRGVLNPSQYGAFFDATLPLFSREQMPIMCFSGDTWPANEQGNASGFGVLDNADVLREIQRVNTVYQWKGVPVTPSPKVQVPPILGDPLPAVVNATAGLNLRATPSISAAIVGKLAYQASVTEYPANIADEGITRFVFVHDANGNPGWAAQVYLTPVETPTNWLVNLAVPFVSQIDGASAASNNDCGISSLLMLERYWFDTHGLSTPTIPSVDDVEKRSPLAQPIPPHGLTFADIQLLATLTGFQTRYIQPLTMDKIALNLAAGVPVMVLVHYGVFNPVSGSAIPHLCIVKGMNATEFLTHDPYKLGKDYRILKTQLDAAMKVVPGNSMGYQGLTLA